VFHIARSITAVGSGELRERVVGDEVNAHEVEVNALDSTSIRLDRQSDFDLCVGRVARSIAVRPGSLVAAVW
jgi:hypothetical protein